MTLTSGKSTTPRGEPIAFISSTTEDLSSFRSAAEHAAKLAGFRVEMMEYFGASGRPSMDECLGRVARADVVVTISAHRFGWIPDDQPPPGGKSVTQLECEYAQDTGIEVLAFIVDANAPWRDEHRDQFRLHQAMTDGTATPELFATVQREVSGLQRFKAWLSTMPRETFQTPDDLEVKALDALHKWRVRHDEFPPASPLTSGTIDRRALRPYLAFLISRIRGLPLRGVDIGASDPTGDSHCLELSKVYIGLKTTQLEEVSDARQQTDAILRSVTHVRVTALMATIENRRLALLGEPGSGKSTFLNHLALSLAEHALSPDSGWLGHLPNWPASDALVPIIVTLRDLGLAAATLPASPGAATLWQFIEQQLERDQLTSASTALQRALDSNRALVLLDGLDEVTGAERRAFVKAAVAAFMARYVRCRIVITCRSLAWQDPSTRLSDLTSFTLASFDQNDIDAFISAWYEELRRTNAIPVARERELAQALRSAVRRFDLARLASNPLLLTVMALVHTHKGTLPDARAQLYEDTVDLLLWRWEQVKGVPGTGGLRALLDRAGCKDVDLKRTLWALAFESHRDGAASDKPGSLADIGEHRLLKALSRLCASPSLDWAREVVDAMRYRAGLLIERAPEVFTLPHRTFQEYLAGAHLASLGNFAHEAATLYASGEYWRTAVSLAVGRLVYVNGEIDRPLALVASLCPGRRPASDDGWRRACLAGEILEDIGVSRASVTELGRDLIERVPRRITDVLEAGVLSTIERAAAGNILGRLGDPRFRTDRWSLPDEELLGFIHVESGPFMTGSDPTRDPYSQADEPELRSVELKEFYISRFPVTVAQFREFVDVSGAKVADISCLRKIPNHPVARVSWDEARAYCQWLTDRLRVSPTTPITLRQRLALGWEVALPSAIEWERAARGTDGRTYPWGDVFQSSHASDFSSGVNGTTTVGLFKVGVSPVGALDVSGNVWEWTRTADGERRVVRGGGFESGAMGLRIASQRKYYVAAREEFIGFRLAVSRVGVSDGL